MFNKTFKKIEKRKAFTLVELLVVISISLFITSTVIFNYGDFRSNASLSNLTDDIALSIRKAQSYAIGAKGISGVFTNSYGVHFYMNDTADQGQLYGSNKSFLIFFNNNTNNYYDVPPSNVTCGDYSVGNECLEFFQITSADRIESIMLISPDGTTKTPVPQKSTLDIVFTRPEPRAYFCYRTSSSTCNSMNIQAVAITISNGLPTGDSKQKTRVITIQNSGQISVQ